MRKVFLALLAICFVSAMAQEKVYHSFCDEEKEWTMNRLHENEIRSTHLYRMVGDTVIGGTACKKVFYNEAYLGAICEADKKVYYYPKEQTNRHLLYDFGLVVGDEVNTTDFGISEAYVMRVTGIDTEEYDGNAFRHFRLESEEECEDGTPRMDADWYEGIGTAAGPLVSFRDNGVFNALTYENLRNCKVKGNVVFFVEADRTFTKSRLEAEDDGVAYEPTLFCQEGKKWLVNDPMKNESFTYELNGDTIINGITAYKMYRDGIYEGAFFDDCYKTYYIAPEQNIPHLFYNFSLYYGNTTRVTNGKEWVQLFASVDDLPVLFNGNYLNNVNLLFLEIETAYINEKDQDYTSNSIFSTKASQWIEGVGSLNGPMVNFIYPGREGPTTELLACWTPNGIIYDPNGLVSAHFTSITPTPTPTYDLSGRKVAPNAHGIYIEGSKKVVR